MRLLVILACLALAVSAAEPDVAAIRTELHAAIKDRKTDDAAFSRRLETWYATFGRTIRIDHPREHTIYIFGLAFATAPDPDLPKLLQQTPGVTDRPGILNFHLERGDLTTMPFDQKQWLQKPVSGHLRYRLFKSLLAEHPPIGRSKAEIEAILGPPDFSYPDSFAYELGSDLSAFGIDSLRVTFTLKDSKVTEHRFYSE